MSVRDDRHESLRQIVRTNKISTQKELVCALQNEGFNATQGTVSRDIADLNLQKAQGVYVLPQDLHLSQLMHSLVTDIKCAQNQIIIHTQPGAAQSVAAAIDDAQLSGVLGSIAGDDTILVISENDRKAQEFQGEITYFATGL